ncbi:hypothetical protein CEV33_1208 [Brucella grignonensis]|uniref:Uncharacterized protein n=1 Tax=Brucella grignonensis TaxID=94627 RepID=A0A256FC55_9HYPH|nr:hypothetical protein CEV33_1208 [Brucella grignonensis]
MVLLVGKQRRMVDPTVKSLHSQKFERRLADLPWQGASSRLRGLRIAVC